MPSDPVDGSAYDLIRARLVEQSKALAGKLDLLNARRVKVFGGTEMSVLANERVRTEHACIPVDLVPVQGRLLLGFNAFLGLKKETVPADVFALHRFEKDGEAFQLDVLPPEHEHAAFLRDAGFVKDFTELYKYYKDAKLCYLRVVDGKLLAVFQIGLAATDVKVLRWAFDAHGAPRYLDNRGDQDHKFPARHSFEWTRATREDHVVGRHPHISILDEVFIETIGGDLTIKVEDNTATGTGVWSEPVEDKNQSLDDAQVSFAKVGRLILLKVLPYRETAHRYLVFHNGTKEVRRIDAIGESCVELPEGHGIVFPGGYALSTGEVKTFDMDVSGLVFTGVVRSPNGEDVMYAFHDAVSDRSILLAYNLIAKEVSAPILCNGWCTFEDGTMAVFRADSTEPVRVHPLRVWRTAFTSDIYAAQQTQSSAHAGTLLSKVGNAEAVRAISDAGTLKRIVANQSPTTGVYEELIATATRVLDAYPWLAEQDAERVAASVAELRATAELIIDEFEKVQSIKRAAGEALAAATTKQQQLLGELRPDSWTTVDPFVEMMTKLRMQRGHLVSLREQRSIDLVKVTALDEAVKAAFDELVQKASTFMAREGALQPYLDKHDAILVRLQEAVQAAQTTALLEELEALSTQLSLLTEIVGSLKIDDAAQRAKILDDTAAVFGTLNRARALVVDKKKQLLSAEGATEFAAQFKLYAQAVESALALAETPEKTDDALARLLVQLEELEGRFAEFDAFLPELAKKREEVFEAFTAKKQRLLDERQRRCTNLGDSAKRIIDGVKRRALAATDLDALNSLFAGDPMIEKARNVSDELRALGDSAKSEEILGLLKSARDDATRQLRDKAELFTDGGDVVQFGKHKFVVTHQPIDLTLLPREDALAFHLTGTDYFEAAEDAELKSFQDLWESTLVSEDPTVYRAELLAVSILKKAQRGELVLDDERIDQIVKAEALARYDEGYERGVHDTDAAAILRALIGLQARAGTLRHPARARALASMFWAAKEDGEEKRRFAAKARGTARLIGSFPSSSRREAAAAELGAEATAFLASRGVVVDAGAEGPAVGAALLDELAVDPPKFALSQEARKLLDELDTRDDRRALDADLAALGPWLGEQHALAQAWVEAFCGDPAAPARAKLAPAIPEAAAAIVTHGKLARDPAGAVATTVVEGLFGQHPRIEQRAMELRLDEALPRVERFLEQRVPRFRRFQARRQQLVQEAKQRLRLDEVKPRVLSSFVRNKLIQDVYLPLVGDNFAKQMGAAGEKKRTDLMGLLLLISPPGYGKTTLMEYVAARLGLVFVKVNGPALGHEVTSLDPEDAPNSTARQEVEKINFAFELGQNAMLYLDDIQHTSPELLQKFISLCDGSRRIEGVWRGRTKTYDLRGKKFCIVMAGNPYTESGEKFKVPDMLANRADTYNLGDILGGKQDAFALSFLENALTSNSTLQPLAGREMSDVYLLARMASGEEIPTTDLKHGYSGAELDEILRVLRHVDTARKTLLKVNAEYIASASMDDRFRTEPPFKLQGSYRNMNKIAEKIVAVMNDAELERVVVDHYRSESQTLTTGAEHNLLKLAELRGTTTPEQRARWDEIKKGFARIKLTGGRDDDPVARVTATLAGMAERVDAIVDAVNDATSRSEARVGAESARQANDVARLVDALGALQGALPKDTAAASIAKELTALKKAVVAAGDAAREASTAAAASQDAGVAHAAARDAGTAAAFLQKIDDVVAALSGGKVDVHVTAPPPQGVNDLVRLQTILIEASLLPLVKGMASSIEHERANASRLEEALAALRALDDRGIHGTSSHTTAPVYRPYAPKPLGTRTDDEK